MAGDSSQVVQMEPENFSILLPRNSKGPFHLIFLDSGFFFQIRCTIDCSAPTVEHFPSQSDFIIRYHEKTSIGRFRYTGVHEFSRRVLDDLAYIDGFDLQLL
jgi:hypothetical protein